MSALEGEMQGAGPASPFAAYFLRLPLWARLLFVVVLLAAAAGAARVAAVSHPRAVPPEGPALEALFARLFTPPLTVAPDEVITGDLLVERFYIVDLSDGQRYVADFLKGRIESIQTAGGGREPRTYTYVLDLRGMRRERELLSAFVSTVAPPSDPGLGFYLGMFAPEGMRDAFAVNYNGHLPAGRVVRSRSLTDDIQALLVSVSFADVTADARLVGFGGHHYLLSNSERFPLFRSEYGMTRAIFLSELIIVDATSLESRTVYFRLLERYLRPTQR